MKTFYKTIIFTKTPLKKYFRYRDIFQVYPLIMDKMPYSQIQSHYPVILEYWTAPEEKIERETEFENLRELFSTTATTLTKIDKIISLLTTFTNHHFFRYTDIGVWGTPILNDYPGEDANPWSSKWTIIDYHWPEMVGHFNITNFTQPSIPEVNYEEHWSYFVKNPNFDSTIQREISFPKTIISALDSYFAADIETREIINAAMSYSNAAVELRSQKKTLALLSSFTAVETMINLENKDVVAVNCTECGQLRHTVAKKYRDYLLKFIGNTTHNKRKFNNYYTLRSKIIHTGQRLETENLYNNLSKQKQNQEYITLIEILQIGKLAIMNWLLKSPAYENKL